MSHEIRRMREGLAQLVAAIHAESSAAQTLGNAAWAAGDVASGVTRQVSAADEVRHTMVQFHATGQRISSVAEW